MDELDKLKGAWGKGDASPAFSHQDISGMMHRRSKSIVKWIFIISVIELLLGLALGFSIDLDLSAEPRWTRIAYRVLDVVYYPVIIYFIYQFFQSYVGLKNTVSVKAHLDAVMRSRHYVEQYIRFNIYFLFPGFVINLVEEAIESSQKGSWGYVLFMTVCYLLVMVIFYYLIIRLMKFYYRVLYRRLISKLEHNQEELARVEE